MIISNKIASTIVSSTTMVRECLVKCREHDLEIRAQFGRGNKIGFNQNEDSFGEEIISIVLKAHQRES